MLVVPRGHVPRGERSGGLRIPDACVRSSRRSHESAFVDVRPPARAVECADAWGGVPLVREASSRSYITPAWPSPGRTTVPWVATRRAPYQEGRVCCSLHEVMFRLVSQALVSSSGSYITPAWPAAGRTTVPWIATRRAPYQDGRVWSSFHQVMLRLVSAALIPPSRSYITPG